MNFEKIKNYNQLLLSIAGTGMIVFFLVIGGIILVDEINRPSFSNDTPQGLMAEVETKQLLKDSLRKQIITFNSIEIIDSTNQIFILPVTQATLKEVAHNADLFGLINSYPSSDYERFSYQNDNSYNNLILFDAFENKNEFLFPERICISDYMIEQSAGEKYLLISGTSKDSNQDKYLNSQDLQELYIYKLGAKKMSKFQNNESYSTISIMHPSKTDFIFGKFGLDTNKDGKFDPSKEPKVIKKIDLENAELVNVIDQDQMNLLQKRLEGI